MWNVSQKSLFAKMIYSPLSLCLQINDYLNTINRSSSEGFSFLRYIVFHLLLKQYKITERVRMLSAIESGLATVHASHSLMFSLICDRINNNKIIDFLLFLICFCTNTGYKEQIKIKCTWKTYLSVVGGHLLDYLSYKKHKWMKYGRCMKEGAKCIKFEQNFCIYFVLFGKQAVLDWDNVNGLAMCMFRLMRPKI